MARGAFRFTTSVLGRQREIRARVGTATIGIRGTDVWGKHEDSRDFVVLLEGQIEIERDGRSVAMSEPLSLFMAPAGQPVNRPYRSRRLIRTLSVVGLRKPSRRRAAASATARGVID